MTAPGHVVLVGLMGTGKTTIGRALATRLGRPLLDSDAIVESRTGRTVREIFATDGEPAFRKLETAALLDSLAEPEPLVIAAAGGVVLSAVNRRALKETAGVVVVWLCADPALLAERATSGTHRPLLDEDPAGTLQQMAADREPLYREVADIAIDTGHRQAAAIARRLAAIIAERA